MSMLLIRGGRVFDGERLRPEPALDVASIDRMHPDPVADPAVLAGMATNLMLVVRGGRVVLDRTGGKDR